MSRIRFDKDVKVGEWAERKLVEDLAEVYPFIGVLIQSRQVIFNNWNSDFDIGIPLFNSGRTLHIEVKNDSLKEHTGNVAIEFECRGKPSGIAVTKAKWWASYYKNEFHILPVEILKDMIEKKKYKTWVYGGDDQAAKMYLFSQTLFNEWSFTVNDLKRGAL